MLDFARFARYRAQACARWNVSTPSSTALQPGSVSVAELARRLDVSETTVRRDLELLEEQRLLARTHGGAVTRGVAYELPLSYRGLQHADEKRRIAVAAGALVRDGLAVGLTGGTTTTAVARVLAERERLTWSRTRSTSPATSRSAPTSSWW